MDGPPAKGEHAALGAHGVEPAAGVYLLCLVVVAAGGGRFHVKVSGGEGQGKEEESGEMMHHDLVLQTVDRVFAGLLL